MHAMRESGRSRGRGACTTHAPYEFGRFRRPLSGDDECPVHVGVDVALEVVLTRLEGADRRLDGLATVAGRAKGQLLAALLRIDADVVGRAVVVHEGDREV